MLNGEGGGAWRETGRGGQRQGGKKVERGKGINGRMDEQMEG